MSLTSTQTQTRSLPKAGAVVAVVMLHLVMFYAINNGLNMATMVQPLESMVAVFVPADKPQAEPPVEKIKLPDAKLSDVQVEEPSPIPIEIPPDVPVAETGSAITVELDAGTVLEADSFSIKSRIDPQYPPSSQRAGEQGTVLLELIIGPDGKPIEVNVARSSGYNALDQAAVTAVRKWRFATHASGSARLRLPVTFKLETVR